MSDESRKSETDAGPVGGEKLRAARRANDISVRDVAKELHIDEPKVRALEKNEFELLGAPVFAKGHLKKYAELVGVPLDDIMADYYQLTRSVGSPPLVGRTLKPGGDINIAPWIGGFVIILIVAAGLYWWFEMRDVTAPAGADPGQLAPFSSSGAADDEAVADIVREPPPQENAMTAAPAGTDPQAAADPSPEPAGSAAVDTPPPATSPPASQAIPATRSTTNTPAAANDGNEVLLVLTFSGDCWTEVSDAGGRQLFYNLAAAGRVLSLRGPPPLRVILGDATKVSMTVDGAARAIPESARRGRLARLTINAP
jgi:cytoskeleton protein RodZ